VVLETAWKSLTDTFSSETLITWGTLVAHEVFYFAVYLPFLLCDFIPAFQKYKIQPTKNNTWPMIRNCLKKLMITHFGVQTGMMIVFRPIMLKLGLSVSLPLPTWTELIAVALISLIIEDFYFYWVHRLLHHGVWYKYVHKIHHDHAAPFGIAAEYAHPIETMFLGIGSVIGPMILTRHLFSLWFYLFVRLYQTVEVHCGYDFPWSFTKIIPFYGGAIFHDFHHETFTGNFSSTFTYLDYLFGTSKAYYERAKKLQSQPKKQA